MARKSISKKTRFGLDLDDLTHEAKTCRNWTEFRNFLLAWMD